MRELLDTTAHSGFLADMHVPNVKAFERNDEICKFCQWS